MLTSTLAFYFPVPVGPILSPNNLSLFSCPFNVCVHVRLCSGCVQLYLLMCTGALGGQRLVKASGIVPQMLSPSCVLKWGLSLALSLPSEQGWLNRESQRSTYVCLSCPRGQECAITHLALCVFWRLNSVPHAGKASAWLTEPSQQPSRLSFKCKFCIS